MFIPHFEWRRSAPRTVREYDVVKLNHDVEAHGVTFVKGTEGVIVHVYGDGDIFAVEFDDPVADVVTLKRSDFG